jgi:putative membrane protein
MTKHLAQAAGLAACGLLALSLTFAQEPKTASEQKTAKSSHASTSGTANRMTADSNFATKAAEGGMAEVQLGNLAKEHAASEDVKKFGQLMVDDHTKINDELKPIAAKKNITLPANVNAKQQAAYDRLSKLSGAEFDRAYMKDMVTDHRADISEFKKESTSGADADFKAFAGKNLPTLEHHLQEAERVYAMVKGGSKSKSK